MWTFLLGGKDNVTFYSDSSTPGRVIVIIRGGARNNATYRLIIETLRTHGATDSHKELKWNYHEITNALFQGGILAHNPNFNTDYVLDIDLNFSSISLLKAHESLSELLFLIKLKPGILTKNIPNIRSFLECHYDTLRWTPQHGKVPGVSGGYAKVSPYQASVLSLLTRDITQTMTMYLAMLKLADDNPEILDLQLYAISYYSYANEQLSSYIVEYNKVLNEAGWSYRMGLETVVATDRLKKIREAQEDVAIFELVAGFHPAFAVIFAMRDFNNGDYASGTMSAASALPWVRPFRAGERIYVTTQAGKTVLLTSSSSGRAGPAMDL
jgi:hypothetical protein